MLGAHDGGVFGLCALRDGTLVSGGGRDRRVVLWGSDYSKLQEVEVSRGRAAPLPGTAICPRLICSSSSSIVDPPQVPEDFGPVRTVAEGQGDLLYVGTTRNSILQGSVHTGFSLLVQVSTLSRDPPLPFYYLPCLPSPLPAISLPCTSLPGPSPLRPT